MIEGLFIHLKFENFFVSYGYILYLNMIIGIETILTTQAFGWPNELGI